MKGDYEERYQPTSGITQKETLARNDKNYKNCGEVRATGKGRGKSGKVGQMWAESTKKPGYTATIESTNLFLRLGSTEYRSENGGACIPSTPSKEFGHPAKIPPGMEAPPLQELNTRGQDEI